MNFSSPSWRPLNHLKGSRVHHPKKVTSRIARYTIIQRIHTCFSKCWDVKPCLAFAPDPLPQKFREAFVKIAGGNPGIHKNDHRDGHGWLFKTWHNFFMGIFQKVPRKSPDFFQKFPKQKLPEFLPSSVPPEKFTTFPWLKGAALRWNAAWRSGKLSMVYFMGLEVITLSWNSKQPVLNGCLVKQPFPVYRFGTTQLKHALKHGCLGYQDWAIFSFWQILKDLFFWLGMMLQPELIELFLFCEVISCFENWPRSSMQSGWVMRTT